MKRWIGWTAAVAALVVLWVALMFAPHLMDWIGLAWAIGLPVAAGVTLLLAWRRNKRVTETLRPYGHDFITLQDDFLGRPHTAGTAWPDSSPTPTLVEDPRPDPDPFPEHRRDAHS